MAAVGRPKKPNPSVTQVNIRLDADQSAKLDKIRNKQQFPISRNALALALLIEAIEKHVR
jgi:hypothetical protein